MTAPSAGFDAAVEEARSAAPASSPPTSAESQPADADSAAPKPKRKKKKRVPVRKNGQFAGSKTIEVEVDDDGNETPTEATAEVKAEVSIPKLTDEQLAAALKLAADALLEKLRSPKLSKDEALSGADAFRPVLDHYFPKAIKVTGIWSGPIAWAAIVGAPRVVEGVPRLWEWWRSRRAPKPKIETAADREAVASSFRRPPDTATDTPPGFVPPLSSRALADARAGQVASAAAE